MKILLDDNEIQDVLIHDCTTEFDLACDYIEAGAKAQAKKILIELQAIYNLPDEGMFHNKMGEFIKSLKGEIG